MTDQERDALVTICLMAAFADGQKGDRERAHLKSIFDVLDADASPALYSRVLLGQADLEAEARKLVVPAHRTLAYEMAVGVCDADGKADGAEAAFLDRLRTALDLDMDVARDVNETGDALADVPRKRPRTRPRRRGLPRAGRPAGCRGGGRRRDGDEVRRALRRARAPAAVACHDGDRAASDEDGLPRRPPARPPARRTPDQGAHRHGRAGDDVAGGRGLRQEALRRLREGGLAKGLGEEGQEEREEAGAGGRDRHRRGDVVRLHLRPRPGRPGVLRGADVGSGPWTSRRSSTATSNAGRPSTAPTARTSRPPHARPTSARCCRCYARARRASPDVRRGACVITAFSLAIGGRPPLSSGGGRPPLRPQAP